MADIFVLMEYSIWPYNFTIWSTPDVKIIEPYGVLYCSILSTPQGSFFLPHGALSDLLQKSAHHNIPHPMEYSISTYLCAIWSTPECLDFYARWSSKMIKKQLYQTKNICQMEYSRVSRFVCQTEFSNPNKATPFVHLHVPSGVLHFAA